MADEGTTYQSATRDVLLSASKIIGSSCVDANLAFAKCKSAHSDPEACLKLGAAVLECNNKVFREIDSKCPSEFETYRKCMDKTQMNFNKCRDAEDALCAAFDSA